MTKAPKKRNKKYNPHKRPVLRMQYVQDPAMAVGFDPDKLKPLRVYDEADPYKPWPVEVDDDQITDVMPFVRAQREQLLIWCYPEGTIQLTNNIDRYKEVMLDATRLYSKMLHVVCGCSRAQIEAWRTPFEGRIVDAWRARRILLNETSL